MNIVIRSLTNEMLDDYLDFFDHIAFSDHKEWSGCYCVHFHLEEKPLRSAIKNNLGRDYAIEFIQDNIIQGYLAYLNESVVGWCNANDKRGFSNLVERKELWDGADHDAKVKSVVCFLIAPDMRGKGIATQLLNRVCQDAMKEGYEYIEAYPRKGETDIYVNHHGPYALYDKFGFMPYKEMQHDTIVRKCLKE